MASPFDYAWSFLKGDVDEQVRIASDRRPYKMKSPDSFGNIEYDNQQIANGPEHDSVRRQEREKLRALASRLLIPHNEIPYPVPPETLEWMKYMETRMPSIELMRNPV
jgi:hypothetical protein